MLTKKRKSTLLTLSILMGLTSCTQASEVIQTPDVVVTATKTQQEVKAVPNAVEVITSEDIEQLGKTILNYDTIMLNKQKSMNSNNQKFNEKFEELVDKLFEK